MDITDVERDQESNNQRIVVTRQQLQVAEVMATDSLDPATRRDQLLYKEQALEIAWETLIELTLEKRALNNRMGQAIRCWAELGPPGE